MKMSESPVESQAELPVRVLLVGAQHPAARPLAEALAAAVGCAAVRVTESAPQDWLRAGFAMEFTAAFCAVCGKARAAKAAPEIGW